jgi:hypothetical protein
VRASPVLVFGHVVLVLLQFFLIAFEVLYHQVLAG